VSLSLQHGDVTIVAAHVNGYSKESYEPLWDTLLENSRSGTSKLKIRGIWIADMAHQNANVVINEEFLGEDYDLFDHAQDLLRLVSSVKICHCQLLGSDIAWKLRSRCSGRLPSATFHQLGAFDALGPPNHNHSFKKHDWTYESNCTSTRHLVISLRSRSSHYISSLLQEL
jgi:hypothetical protein